MKRHHLLATCCLLPFALTADLTRGQDTEVTDVVDATPTPTSDTDVDLSLANLIDMTRRADDVRAQLEALRKQLGLTFATAADPGAEPTIGTLPTVFEAVIASARAGYMTLFEAAFLREQVIEARLERLLAALARRAKMGGWDEDVHRRVIDVLVQRARAAVDYPDAEAARARLQAILEDLRCGAPGVTAEDLRLELLRGRMVRYLQFLSARARTLGVDRAIAQPYILMVIERGRLAARQR